MRFKNGHFAKKLSPSQISAVKISLIYLLFAALWIFFSDKLLGMLVDPKSELTQMQTIKGLFFILVTSSLIYLLIKRYAKPEIVEGLTPETKSSLVPGSEKYSIQLTVVFIFFAVAIGFFGYLYYSNQKDRIRDSYHSELNAIASLKVSQIKNWQKERFGDAEAMLENNIVHSFVKNRVNKSTDGEDEQKLKVWFRTMMRLYDYKDVIILDNKNKVLLNVTETPLDIPEYELKSIEAAVNLKQIKLTDFFFLDSSKNDISLSIVVPVRDIENNSNIIGSIILRIDPSAFLYPLIQSWPIPGYTGETILVRKEENSVLYLNNLKFKKNSALKHSVPLSDENISSVMAVKGIEGMVESYDYRGEKILAVIKPVEGTPWFLIALIDQDEIYSPILEKSIYIGIIFIVLVTGLGLSTGLYFRRQKESHYKRLYETEIKRKIVVEKYNYMSKYANDIIIIMDENLNIIEVNDKTLETYGYTLEELKNMNLANLRTQEEGSKILENLKEIEKNGSIIVETGHLCKNGTVIPVESSIRAITIDSKKFYQSIARNITERKLRDEMLKSSLKEKEVMLREIHHRVKNNLQIISSLLKLQSGYISDPKILSYFEVSQNRVKSMALVHQSLYKSKELSKIDFYEYATQLANYLLQSYGPGKDEIVIKVKSNGIFMGVDTAVPCGLLVNELVSNALKYAFTGKKEGCIEIEMNLDDKSNYVLIVRDNGIGISKDIDVENTESLGMQLVMSLKEQLDGEITVNREAGTEFVLKFPPLTYFERN